MGKRQKLTGTGTLGALNATKDFDVTEHDAAKILFGSGAFVGTVSFSISDDGTNFVPCNGTPFDSATPVGNNTAVSKGYVFDTLGMKTLRLTMSAYTSGTASTRFVGLTRG